MENGEGVITDLSMQVVGHIDDIVDNLTYLLNRKPFQVPVRSWSCHIDGLSRKKILREYEEGKIICAVVGTGW